MYERENAHWDQQTAKARSTLESRGLAAYVLEHIHIPPYSRAKVEASLSPVSNLSFSEAWGAVELPSVMLSVCCVLVQDRGIATRLIFEAAQESMRMVGLSAAVLDVAEWLVQNLHDDSRRVQQDLHERASGQGPEWTKDAVSAHVEMTCLFALTRARRMNLFGAHVMLVGRELSEVWAALAHLVVCVRGGDDVAERRKMCDVVRRVVPLELLRMAPSGGQA